MNWENLKKVWENKADILEGFKNKIFKKEHIESLAEERLSICRSNQCGFYDKDGISDEALVKGAESCRSCGCDLSLKTRCLHCKCPIDFWAAVTDEETSDKINEIIE